MLQRKPFFLQISFKRFDLVMSRYLARTRTIGCPPGRFWAISPMKRINCSVFISYEQPPTLLSLHGWSLVSFLRTAFYLQPKWFSSLHFIRSPVHQFESCSVIKAILTQLSPTSFSAHNCPPPASQPHTAVPHQLLRRRPTSVD